jgi:Holliday junction resolvasome RuvABC endonuclease subunit
VIIAGLDPSLRQFGWAVIDTRASMKKRCIARGRFKTLPVTLFIDRYIFLREELRSLLREFTPDRVGIEYPIFNDLYSEGMYGLFLYSCEALRTERMDTVFFSPPQVKAHAREFLGRPKGWKMAKPDMVEAAKAHTGGKGRWNHNEADAYWVASSAARFWLYYDGLLEIDALTPVEKKEFLNLHTYVRGKKAGRTVRSGMLFREDDRFFLWSEEGKIDGEEKEHD